MSRWESTHPHRPWHHFFYFPAIFRFLFFSFFGKISGIFHYFNESFVINPLNDFERHFNWLSKTSLLLKIGQSPWKLCMVEYLSVSVWFWDFTNLSFPTVFVAVDPLPLATKGFAAKPSLIWRRGSQNDRGWFPPARWWLCRSETAKIPLIPDWPCTSIPEETGHLGSSIHARTTTPLYLFV